MKNIDRDPKSAALVGILLALPLVLINAVVSNHWEPLNSWIRTLGLNNLGGFGVGFLVFAVLLLLLPLGAFIAARPILQRGMDGTRMRNIPIVLAALLLAGFAALSIGVGEEIYRCEILQIENCD